MLLSTKLRLILEVWQDIGNRTLLKWRKQRRTINVDLKVNNMNKSVFFYVAVPMI